MDTAWAAQLRKGLVELAVLAALRREEAYGYQLVQRVNAQPGLNLNEPTIYPLLARLLRDGFLDSRTVPSLQGPPRRYYRLTASGVKRYNQMVRLWRAARQSLDHLIDEGTP